MNTRMSKYDEVENDISSRVKRNSKLYNEINNTEIENFKMRSNATVIGNHDQDIDIEKIKKILDTKYKDAPKRKSIRITDEEIEEEKHEAPTKEYDLNLFLEKAKGEKEETYEEVRAKKLRDTQFDILKNLKIDEVKDEPEEKIGPRPEDNDLLNLINTITINENKEKQKEDDIITSDIADASNSITSSSIDDEDVENDEDDDDTDSIDETNRIEEIKNEIEKVEKTSAVLTKNENLDNSFYTKTNVFKKKDLKDSEADDDEKVSIVIKIIIALLVVGICVGLFLFLKSIINF